MQAVESQFTQGIYLNRSTSFNEFTEGTKIETKEGGCIQFENHYPAKASVIDEDTLRARLEKELTLVPGIGNSRAEVLRKKGIETLSDLKTTRFKEYGELLSEIIAAESPKEISILFQDLGRGNDPLLLGFAGQNPEKLLFFDIETLGMANSPIFLFGCGEYTHDGLKVTQYLARNFTEELPALISAANHFKSDTSVVSYNGKVFDIPYLNERLAYFGEQKVKPHHHFDLLFTTRRLFGKNLTDCRLGTVEEELLHLQRVDDVPGYLVPAFYQRWLMEKNPEILFPVIKHKEADVANLASLLTYQQELLFNC